MSPITTHVLDTSLGRPAAGMAVTLEAQKPDGSAFPGLYAVGTPVAGLEGGPRAGYVGGLSKAFVLGLLAAEHAAAQP